MVLYAAGSALRLENVLALVAYLPERVYIRQVLVEKSWTCR